MEYKGYIVESHDEARWYVRDAKRGLIASTYSEESAKEIVDRLAGEDEKKAAKGGKKKFTVCAAVQCRVYCTIEAESMEDAIDSIRLGAVDSAEWEGEEWVEHPTVVNVTEDETGDMEDYNG